VAAFREGATPDEIVQQYPSLRLADVYAVIGYYLRRREEVERYLRRREKQAEKVRKENEARFPPVEIRERLLARRKPFENHTMGSATKMSALQSE